MKRYALAWIALALSFAMWTTRSTSTEYPPPSGRAIAASATAPLTCAAGLEGAAYYDTDAGDAGTADDGRLCCCGNDALQGYLYRDCATPTTEFASATASNCGT